MRLDMGHSATWGTLWGAPIGTPGACAPPTCMANKKIPPLPPVGGALAVYPHVGGLGLALVHTTQWPTWLFRPTKAAH